MRASHGEDVPGRVLDALGGDSQVNQESGMDHSSTAGIDSRPEDDPEPSPSPAAPAAPATDADPAQSDTAPTEPGHTRVETPDTVAADARRQLRGLRFALGVAV